MTNPPLRIEHVTGGSPAARAGVKSGDRLLALNGHPVRDIIDVLFYAEDGPSVCMFQTREGQKRVALEGVGEESGLVFAPMRTMRCGNACVFCFIDQNPAGLRPTLYVKDEDYRLSFLHGSYVTLSNIGKQGLDRIIAQRLSPLYVSIHALDLEKRKKLLGLRRDDRLHKKMRALLDAGIELHGQIVLCPEWNDGEELERTVEGLAPYYPGLRTLSVVPVGLTLHRQGLAPLRSVQKREAADLLDRYGLWQRAHQKTHGESFLFFSDEFYLLAGRALPPVRRYGDFWQVENGVGMTALFLSRFQQASRGFPRKCRNRSHWIMVTGRLAEPVLAKHVIPRLSRIGNMKVTLLGVTNRFYGESVTVSGLLAGCDILDALRAAPRDAAVLLPPNCLNPDGLFLDGTTPQEIASALGREIRIPELDFWTEMFA